MVDPQQNGDILVGVGTVNKLGVEPLQLPGNSTLGKILRNAPVHPTSVFVKHTKYKLKINKLA